MLIILPRRPKLAMALVVFGVAAGLLGGLSNVASL
jgi:membrane-associated PAP2 superfamily phosphatase